MITLYWEEKKGEGKKVRGGMLLIIVMMIIIIIKGTGSETDMRAHCHPTETKGEKHVTSLKAVWLQRISKMVTLGF